MRSTRRDAPGNDTPTRVRAHAVRVDCAVRRSIERRGHPRNANGLYRLRADVLRRVPDADLGLFLTTHGDLIVFLDGRDLRDVLPRARPPEPGTPEYERHIGAARADLRVRRALRLRNTRRPSCGRPRQRESRPRVRRAGRSARATRAGPRSDDDDPEPGGAGLRTRDGQLEPERVRRSCDPLTALAEAAP
jgi:hypothetical protein